VKEVGEGTTEPALSALAKARVDAQWMLTLLEAEHPDPDAIKFHWHDLGRSLRAVIQELRQGETLEIEPT